MDDVISKTCRRCGTQKPVDSYGVNKAEPDGRNGRCRACLAELHAAKTEAKRLAGLAVLAAGEKPCAACKVTKPLDAFAEQWRSLDGHQKKCLDCWNPVGDTKTCGSCREVKPMDAFNKAAKSRDGRQGYCRDCARNKLAASHVANPDRARDYYVANRDATLARMRERYQEDPSKYLIKGRKRRLSIRLVDLGDVHAPYVRVSRVDCYLCGHALSGEVHLDHVIPLSRGGMHTTSNVLPTHPECNLRKHDLLLSELRWYSGPTNLGAVARMICS